VCVEWSGTRGKPARSRHEAPNGGGSMRSEFRAHGIVQDHYDVVCPMESAWALHRAWPEADLIITSDSGHSAFDPPNSRALVAGTDRLAFS
jgi:hypothetical protein